MLPREAPQDEPVHDEAWFEDLYRSHHGAVLAYARRRVADADDVVAEVFSAAWRSRERVPTPPLPWLYRTASNHVLHAHRAQGRRARLSLRAAQLDTVSPDPADRVAARLDASRRVAGALERLSAADRELLRLVAWEDLAQDQIAYVLGCSTATLRVRLRRARVRFAAQLEAVDAGSDDGSPARPPTPHPPNPAPNAAPNPSSNQEARP